MANKVIKVTAIQQRHDTAVNWESKNPILLDGEQITVVFTDGSIHHKTGYGGKRYNELPFDGNSNCKPSTLVETTLLANAWVNKQQTVTVNGLGVNQNGVVSLSQTFSSAQYDATVAAKLIVSKQNEGSLIFTCNGVVPQVDIPISIILLG